MDKKISSIGIIILVIGIILILTFWPLFGVKAMDIDRKDNGFEFKQYDIGDKITIHGTITDIKVNDFPNYYEEIGVEDNVLFELSGNVWILIENEDSFNFKIGKDVYCDIILEDQDIFGSTFEYWTLDSKDDINLKNNLNYMFYFIAGTGTVIAAVGFVRE